MKLVILSDIHANPVALRCVLEAEPDADAVYCAGDLVDCGPEPYEAVEMCRCLGICAVKGNHDAIVLREPGGRLSVPYNAAEYARAVLGEVNLKYLDSLPDSLFWKSDGVGYCMTHRYSLDYSERIATAEEFDEYWRTACPDSCSSGRRRLIFGHTHEQYIVSLSGGREVINPGSVSYQRGNERVAAEYAIIENGNIRMMRREYPTEELLKRACELELAPGLEWIRDMFRKK